MKRKGLPVGMWILNSAQFAARDTVVTRSAYPCEVCERPSEETCSGLDTPELRFCAKDAREHEATCPHIKDGTAAMSRPK